MSCVQPCNRFFFVWMSGGGGVDPTICSWSATWDAAFGSCLGPRDLTPPFQLRNACRPATHAGYMGIRLTQHTHTLTNTLYVGDPSRRSKYLVLVLPLEKLQLSPAACVNSFSSTVSQNSQKVVLLWYRKLEHLLKSSFSTGVSNNYNKNRNFVKRKVFEIVKLLFELIFFKSRQINFSLKFFFVLFADNFNELFLACILRIKVFQIWFTLKKVEIIKTIWIWTLSELLVTKNAENDYYF